MRVAGIHLGVGQEIILPTGMLLFNGVNGDTTTINSGLIGDVALFSGAVISTAHAFEGISSCRIPDNNYYARYSPTPTLDNDNVAVRDFYVSVAFRLDAVDSNQYGILYAYTPSGLLVFEAYMQNGVVTVRVRENSSTIHTLIIPDFVGVADTWYKLELIRNSANNELTAKIGSDFVKQSITTLTSPISAVDVGSSLAARLGGYVDRFIYQLDSCLPY